MSLRSHENWGVDLSGVILLVRNPTNPGNTLGCIVEYTGKTLNGTHFGGIKQYRSMVI